MPRIVEGSFAGLHGDEIALFNRFLAGLPGAGVEIGCCDGFSTVHILEASLLHLTSIDPFVPDSMEPSLRGLPSRFAANLAPYGSRSTLLVSRSELESASWKTPLAFLFIDGDHRYEAVRRDLEEWSPHLVVGGILAMHDSRMNRGGAPFHPGPSRVADESVYGAPGRWRILGEAFSLTLARKLA